MVIFKNYYVGSSYFKNTKNITKFLGISIIMFAWPTDFFKQFSVILEYVERA